MDQKHTAYYVLCQPSRNNCAAVVSYMANYFKQAGLYFESTKDLCVGDIVFFQNSNGLCHVGYCVDWGDSTFTTIEGNHNNKVDYGEYYYSQRGGYVAGFAHPRYTDDCTRAAALAYAKSQIGYTEGANNWNKYADQLDKMDYFADCGKKQFLPWCAVFICAIMVNAYKDDPEPTPPTPPTPTKDSYKVVTNSGDALRIREKPTTDSKQVGWYDNGSIITPESIVEGEDIGGVNTWAKTDLGYCSCKYLVDVTPAPTPTPTTKTYRVQTNSGVALRIREEPTTDSAQIGWIDNGDTCEVDDITNNWAHVVDYKGITGYSYAQYLKEV